MVEDELLVTRVGNVTVYFRLKVSNIVINSIFTLLSCEKSILKSPHNIRIPVCSNTRKRRFSNLAIKLSILPDGDLYMPTIIYF